MSERLVCRSHELVQRNQRLLRETRLYIALSRRICIGWSGIGGGADLLPPRDPENARWPLAELQGRVREKLGRGRLFLLRNHKQWASPASGGPCRICSQVISTGNECVVAGSRGYVYTHMICHRLWLQEPEALLAERAAMGRE